jgi:hypothetical protein
VHVPGDGLAQVGRYGQPAGPVGARRAELGRAQQFADGADGVAAQAQRRRERIAVPLSQVPEFAKQRLQHQMERGETDAGLELDPGRAHHPASLGSRVLVGRVEQHRLADPDVTGQQQRLALDAELVDVIAQVAKFVVTPYDPHRLILPRGGRSGADGKEQCWDSRERPAGG